MPRMTVAATPDSTSLRADARTIGLVGLAHGASHFFHLLLPPLFPWLIADFGVSYSQLGAMVSLFFVVSGSGQMAAGFVVDKVGARPVLFAALACFVVAGVLASTAHSYPMLLLASLFAGLGNAPFHPVDFTILNKRVSAKNIGHAFSVHGVSGNLGWALAPVFMTGITTWTGSWRLACAAGGALAAVILLIMCWQREALDDRIGAAPRTAAAGGDTATQPVAAPANSAFAFLRLPAVWGCFAFFFFTTVGLSSVQSYSSPALQNMYGLPLAWTALVVTGFMLCSALGMIGGGFLAARVQRLEKTIAVFLLLAGACLALVGTGWLPGIAAMVVTACAGFGHGLAGPSRDMLIKRAAPPDATGRVYGTVYSGLDLGFALAAPALGWLMDHQMPHGVFFAAAVALVISVLAAGWVGADLQQRQQGGDR